MSEWADGYRAALTDLRTLIASRDLITEPLRALFSDLEGDALAIGHELDNRLQRRRLSVAREAKLPLNLPLETKT